MLQLNFTKKIAKIFNRISESGESVVELVLGLLRPLQKPGKKKGLTGNLQTNHTALCTEENSYNLSC